MAGEHARTFAVVPGVEVVGVTSRGGTSAEELAGRYGIEHAGTDWQAIAEQSGAHGVVVATSHDQTAHITGAAIERGLHVLAEKPVSLDPAEVSSLHQAATAAGVVAMVAMNRRFFRSVLAAIDIVGFHGPVVGVSLNAPDPVGVQRAQAASYDPAVFERWTVANTLHAIDLLRLAGGEVDEVSGMAANWCGEVSRVATLRFASGAIGTYSSHGATAGGWQMRIHGHGVEAELAPLEHGTVRVGSSRTDLPHDDEGVKYGTFGQAEAFRTAVQRGEVLRPGCDLADHARSLELATKIEAIEP